MKRVESTGSCSALREAGRSGNLRAIISLEDELVQVYSSSARKQLGKLISRRGRATSSWLRSLNLKLAQRSQNGCIFGCARICSRWTSIWTLHWHSQEDRTEDCFDGIAKEES